jgi:hypothetical protein
MRPTHSRRAPNFGSPAITAGVGLGWGEGFVGSRVGPGLSSSSGGGREIVAGRGSAVGRRLSSSDRRLMLSPRCCGVVGSGVRYLTDAPRRAGWLGGRALGAPDSGPGEGRTRWLLVRWRRRASGAGLAPRGRASRRTRRSRRTESCAHGQVSDRFTCTGSQTEAGRRGCGGSRMVRMRDCPNRLRLTRFGRKCSRGGGWDRPKRRKRRLRWNVPQPCHGPVTISGYRRALAAYAERGVRQSAGGWRRSLAPAHAASLEP